jgi:hypothetical protein
MYVSLKSNTVIFLFARPGYDWRSFLKLFEKETVMFELYDLRRLVAKIPFKSEKTRQKVDKLAYSGDSIPVKLIHSAAFIKPFPKNKLIIFVNFPEQQSHGIYFRDRVLHNPERCFSITLNYSGYHKEMQKVIGKGRHSEDVFVKMATRYTNSALSGRLALNLPDSNHFLVDDIPNQDVARKIIAKFDLNQFRQSPTLF